jgi:hypothetical protein
VFASNPDRLMHTTLSNTNNIYVFRYAKIVTKARIMAFMEAKEFGMF